jgi:hypothetical protein
MQSAKKILLVPSINKNTFQRGGGVLKTEGQNYLTSKVEVKPDKVKSKIYDKIHKFIQVILKLARKFGYNADLKIKLKDGKYLDKSNVVDLLTHAMSVGKVLYGENEFIELLYDAGVEPELLINENVKNKLIQIINSRKYKQPPIEEMEIERRGQKRVAANSDLEPSGILVKKSRMSDDQEPVLAEHPNSVSDVARDSVIKPVKSLKRKADDSEDIDVFSSKYKEIDDSAIDQNLWEIPSD